MEKKRKRYTLILIIILILLLITLFLTMCSKKNDNNIDLYSSTEGVNRPVLTKNMKAVKWDGKEWVEVKNPDTDTTWYDYKKASSTSNDTSEWANAKTEDGSMWVWIPRYAYKISNKTIDIIFLENTKNSSNSEYIVAPVFTNNVDAGGWDSEIPGFWVAKVEAGKEDEELVFKGNVYSYNNITIGDAYSLCKNLSNKSSDSHLIKSSEWGAVAYLAISSYGRNGIEVSSNNTLVTLDGEDTTSVTAGGNGVDALASNSSEALQNNKNQSTTGNVYGVYDMAGGLWERVAAYINNGNANLIKNGQSLLEDGTTDKSNKYKIVYNHDKNSDTMESNYNLNQSFKGDAIFEISNQFGEKNWFEDYSSFMFVNSPFLHRGGGTNKASGVGIFAYSNTPGQSAKVLGFRCSIVSK